MPNFDHNDANLGILDLIDNSSLLNNYLSTGIVVLPSGPVLIRRV